MWDDGRAAVFTIDKTLQGEHAGEECELAGEGEKCMFCLWTLGGRLYGGYEGREEEGIRKWVESNLCKWMMKCAREQKVGRTMEGLVCNFCGGVLGPS